MAHPTPVRFPDGIEQRITERARGHASTKSAIIVSAVDEWLRMQDHPRIAFTVANTGERRARLVDGPEVWSIIDAWLQHEGDDRIPAIIADAIGLAATQIESALDYWADYPDDIDRLIVVHHDAQDSALKVWERRQAVR